MYSHRGDFNQWRRLKPDNHLDVSKIPTLCLISPLPAATDSPAVQSSWLRHCPPGTFELYVQKQKKGTIRSVPENRVTKSKTSLQSHLCTESQSLIRGLDVIRHNEKHLLALQNKIRLRKLRKQWQKQKVKLITARRHSALSNLWRQVSSCWHNGASQTETGTDTFRINNQAHIWRYDIVLRAPQVKPSLRAVGQRDTF